MITTTNSATRLPHATGKRPAAVMGKVSSKPRTFRDTGLLPLMLLRLDECRWPVGHDAQVLGEYLFCGRQTNGQSYCAKHRLMNHSRRKRS